MDERTARILRATAAALVFATAAFHLWWGFPRALIYARAYGLVPSGGLPPDPRPYFFVAFAFVLLSGPYLVTRRILSLRDAYIAGTVLLLSSIAAWAVWHVTGHGAFLLGEGVTTGGGGGHHHGQRNALFLLLDHFDTEPLESAIKTIELLGIAVFVTLLWRDPAIIPDAGTGETDAGDAAET